MTVGERIKAQRKFKKMTLEEVGDKLGVTRSAIYKYEKGIVTNIPVEVLNRLAEVLECTPNYIMGWSEPITDMPNTEATIRMLVANTERMSSERKSDLIKLLRYMYPELFDARE